jgi:hypothetical protein
MGKLGLMTSAGIDTSYWIVTCATDTDEDTEIANNMISKNGLLVEVGLPD